MKKPVKRKVGRPRKVRVSIPAETWRQFNVTNEIFKDLNDTYAQQSLSSSLSREELATHVGKLISSERNQTHGAPAFQFECAQELKTVIENFNQRGSRAGYNFLGTTEQESLDQICTKLSRIICGSNLQDHWLDIAGYALIAAERAEKPLRKEVKNDPAKS